jgi:hypothetical protein
MKNIVYLLIGLLISAPLQAEQRQNVMPPPGTQSVPAQFMLHCSRDSAGMFHFLEHQYGEVIRAVLTKSRGDVDIYLTVDSGEDGTYTLVGVKDDTACLIFSGGPVLWSDDRPANRSDRRKDIIGNEL